MTIQSPAYIDTSVMQDGQAAGSITPADVRLMNDSLAGEVANTQTGNYTLALTDRGEMVEINSSSATTVTIPTNASVAFDVGVLVDVAQIGTGAVSIAPASGVTAITGKALTLSGQGSVAHLRQRATNSWLVWGDLVTPSPNYTVVTVVGQPITDASGNLWTITSGGQVAFNGTPVSFTSNVTEIAYVSGTVWQENASGSWYSFGVSGGAATLGTGPTTSPLPGGTISGSTTIPTYATPTSTGTTYYVNQSSGSDSNAGTSSGAAWATLQHAASSIAAGSTVLVYNGTYTASGTVLSVGTMGTANSGLNGSASNWTVFKAAPGQSPVIQGNNNGIAVLVVGSSYFCIAGFTVTGMNASLTQSGAFSNHTAQQYNNSGIQFGYDKGSGCDSHHVMVLNCNVSQFPQNGISAQFCDYVTIQGCNVFSNSFYSSYAGSGISLWELHNSDTNSGTHCLLNGNICYNNWNYVGPSGTSATGVTDGEGIIIDNSQNTQSDSVAYTGSVMLSNNICYGNGSNGIECGNSNNCTVIYNTCYQNCGDAANMAYPPITEINVYASLNNFVYNNIISTTSSTQYLTTGSTGSSYGNNITYGGSGTAAGSGNITTNPNFASTTLFTLNAGSPAIDAANTSYVVSADIYGNTRPGTGGYSIGAVQYPS